MIKCLIISSNNMNMLEAPLNCDESISAFDILMLAIQATNSMIELKDEKEFNDLQSAIEYHNLRVDYNEQVYISRVTDNINDAHKLLVTNYKTFIENVNKQIQQEKIKGEELKLKRTKQKLIKGLTKSGYTTDEITEIINKRFGA